jgi:hypothetical protein
MDPDLLAEVVNQFGTRGGLGSFWQEASSPFYFCSRIAFVPSLERVEMLEIVRVLLVFVIT